MKIKLALIAAGLLALVSSAAQAGPQFGIYISTGGGNCGPRPVIYRPAPCGPVVYRPRPVVYYQQPVYYAQPVYSRPGKCRTSGYGYVVPRPVRPVKACNSFGWR